MSTITKKKVHNFVWRSIIFRFGVPKALISDNGKQFDNQRFKSFLAKLGIKNYYLFPTHSQSNGQEEVTITTLKEALKTKLEDHKGKWVEYIPEVLWAYRTTSKSTTRDTPFALAFGTEAVAPIEVGLESPKVKFTNTERNEETLRLNLDLLEEKREQALKRAEDYQQKTSRYYDRKVWPNSFKPGDLVLKKLLPARKDPTHGKLDPIWKDPILYHE